MKLPEWMRTHKIKIFVIASVAVAAIAGYFVWQALQNPADANSAIVERIKQAVSAIYEVPTNEEPSVAQLQNPESVAGEAFYQKAQKDDFVLIYPKAQLAIIYRESSKKLINVDTVTIDSQ